MAKSAYITFDDEDCLDPALFVAEVEKLRLQSGETTLDTSRFLYRANSFVLPRGFEPGRGALLMRRKVVDAIIESGTNLHTLVFKADSTVTFEKLYITSVEEITGTAEAGDDAACLVEIADMRILGGFTSLNKQYNVLNLPETDYYTASKNAGSAWTYATLISNIWSQMPTVFGSLGTSLADFPSGAPTNYFFDGCCAWEALRKVLTDINHTIVLTPDGTFSVVALFNNVSTYAGEQSDYEKHLLVASNSPDVIDLDVLPETVRVFFPKRDMSWQSSTDLQVLTSWDYWRLNPLYSVDVATSSINGNAITQSGSVKPLHDTLAVLTDETGSITNSGAISTRATEVATDYINSLLVAGLPSNNRYSGARSFTVGPDLAAVAYYDFGYGVITETRNLPPEESLGDMIDDGKSGTPVSPTLEHENRSPPHLSQWHIETDRWIVFLSTEAITPGSSGTGTVLQGANGTGITWSATGSSHTATIYNISTAAAIPVNSRQVAFWHLQTKRWVCLPATGQGIPFRNDSGEEVPPGGVMYFTQMEDIDDVPHVIIGKPDTFDRFWFINSPIPVPDGEVGVCYLFMDSVGPVAVNNTDNSGLGAIVGETWGPMPDSWELWKNRPGFTAISGTSTLEVDGQLMSYFKQHEVNIVYGVFYDTLAKDGTALFTIQHRDDGGDFVGSGWDDITVEDFWLNTGDTIDATIKGALHWYSGYWEVLNAYCAVPS